MSDVILAALLAAAAAMIAVGAGMFHPGAGWIVAGLALVPWSLLVLGEVQ